MLSLSMSSHITLQAVMFAGTLIHLDKWNVSSISVSLPVYPVNRLDKGKTSMTVMCTACRECVDDAAGIKEEAVWECPGASDPIAICQ